jgi:hypothetical protein
MQTLISTVRRLTGDVQWPVGTSFSEALGTHLFPLSLLWSNVPAARRVKPTNLLIGPLRGSFPILALRTNKADVAVRVDAIAAQELDGKGEE